MNNYVFSKYFCRSSFPVDIDIYLSSTSKSITSSIPQIEVKPISKKRAVTGSSSSSKRRKKNTECDLCGSIEQVLSCIECSIKLCNKRSFPSQSGRICQACMETE